MNKEKTAKKPKRNLKDANFEVMCRTPLSPECLIKDPYFMNKHKAIHVDDAIYLFDIKSTLL